MAHRQIRQAKSFITQRHGLQRNACADMEAAVMRRLLAYQSPIANGSTPFAGARVDPRRIILKRLRFAYWAHRSRAAKTTLPVEFLLSVAKRMTVR
jgi:hypothetical protein